MQNTEALSIKVSDTKMWLRSIIKTGFKLKPM